MFLFHKFAQLVGAISSGNKLPILFYHQVINDHDDNLMGEITETEFSRQMEVIARYYNPILVSEAVDLLKKNKLPANSVCITLDDGYLNNLTMAAPILSALNIPATVYVATAFTDGKMMWNEQIIAMISDRTIEQFDLSLIDAGQHTVHDDESRKQLVYHVLAQLKYIELTERLVLVEQLLSLHHYEYPKHQMLNRQQIKALENSHIEIAAHTHDHPILAVLPVEQQQQQIETNLAFLQACQVDVNGMGFAYPNGKFQQDYTQQTADLIKKMGLSYAVTTHDGVCTPATDRYHLPRISPWETRPLRFHLRLLLDLFK